MNSLPKNHTEFCRMIVACVDLSEYPTGTTLRQVICTEKPGQPFNISTVEDWLRGLPSACTIPFACFEINRILESCGNGHWSDDDYWRFCASRVLAFAKGESS